MATLRAHTGLVKGVVFDPVGKYLASQSDDRSLRVWRTSDWREEAAVTAPFEECGATTHVLRPGAGNSEYAWQYLGFCSAEYQESFIRFDLLLRCSTPQLGLCSVLQ